MTATEPRPVPTTQPPPAPTPPERRTGQVVLGALLLLAGLAWLLDAAGVVAWRWPTLLAGALVAVGVGLLLTARRGGHGGLVAIGIVLAVVASVTLALPPAAVVGAVGDVVEAPTDASELRADYGLGAGTLTLDLRDVVLDEPTAVSAQVGFGELVVHVPPEAAVDVRARSGAGEVVVGTQERSGLGPSLHAPLGDADGERLELDAQVGFGTVTVQP